MLIRRQGMQPGVGRLRQRQFRHEAHFSLCHHLQVVGVEEVKARVAMWEAMLGVIQGSLP